MENIQKKIREINLFDLTSFFWPGFLKFSGPLTVDKEALFGIKKCYIKKIIYATVCLPY